jgi:outer membrane cobalamin receptor
MGVNSAKHNTPFQQKAIIFSLIIIAFLLYFHEFSSGQDLNQRISFSLRNVPLVEIINKIEDIAQVKFSYSPQLIPLNKKMSVKVRNKSVTEVLDAVFKANGINYIIVENQIVLKPLYKGNNDINTINASNEKKNYTVSGYLKDKKTGEVMIGASVFANGTTLGAITNAYGFYSLTLGKGSYDIVYSFIGYKNISQNIDLNEDKIISVELEDAMLDIKPVEVKDSDNKSGLNNNQFSEMKLSPKTLTQLPGFLGDIDVIKSLQIVPGIKSYGDGSTLFYVRGGNSDQNLILLDDAPIYNPSHLFGFVTAVTPDAIKDVEAFKGDFPANYGGRLSSVIDIRTKDGDMKKLGFSGSIGPYTSDLSVDGPIINDKCSFYLSGRLSNLNWLTSYENENLSLKFFDINAKVNYKLNDNNHIFLTLYGGNDSYNWSPTEITWDNILGTLRWNHIFNDKLFSNTTFYSTQYDYYLYFNNNINDYWGSSISDKTIKTDFTYYLNPKNTIKAGIDASIQLSDPGNLHLSDPSEQANVPAVSTYSSREFDAYVSNEQYITNNLSVRYGLRVPVWLDMGPTSVYSFDQNHNVIDTLVVGKGYEYASFISPEPRINLKYSLDETSCLKASYSRTTQFVQLLSNTTSPFSSLEEWVPCGPNIEPPKADQYALGYFRSIDNQKLSLSVEAYYKQFHNQMDYADHADIFFNPLLEGQLRFGKAWSYGTEFMLCKEEGNLTWRIGYTYSRIFEQINGVNNGNTFPSSYDSPNNICLNASYRMNKHWSFSANWVYYTGEAITTPIGFYYYNGYSVPLYGNKNNDRLPDYNRLDISITYKLSKPARRYQQTLIFTVYNVYARKNPISVNFNKIMDDNGDFVVPSNVNGGYDLIPTTLSVVGIIPSITYNFKFR